MSWYQDDIEREATHDYEPDEDEQPSHSELTGEREFPREEDYRPNEAQKATMRAIRARDLRLFDFGQLGNDVTVKYQTMATVTVLIKPTGASYMVKIEPEETP